jgi:hypothetical protein
MGRRSRKFEPRSLLEDVVFIVDECLGKSVADALRSFGAQTAVTDGGRNLPALLRLLRMTTARATAISLPRKSSRCPERGPPKRSARTRSTSWSSGEGSDTRSR